MRVAVLGAGAIGGLVGARLAHGGTETHLVARGAHLQAMRRNGLRIIDNSGDDDLLVDVPCTDDPAEIGLVDVIFLGLKAHSYAGAGHLLAPLLGPDTAVVAGQNGIPWWYFHAHGGPFDGTRIETVDPDGRVSAAIPPERAIGCVAYPAAEIVEPGVIRHIEGTRFAIGEPDRSISARCGAFSEAMTAGGLRCPIDENLRNQIWVKVMGNATFNPLSALTGATLAQICRYRPTRDLVTAMMEEIVAVATALACEPSVSIERRIRGAERVGHHRTSMLQDREAGRQLELEVLLGAVIELGVLTRVATTQLEVLYKTTALLDAVIRRDEAIGGTVESRPALPR
jgi:2-dehydropantoate 2-reductase